MFELRELTIPGCLEIQPIVRGDTRGRFVKTFHHAEFERLGLATGFRERYYSRSTANVVRGLHFQTPPHDHVKLVACPDGAVLDVLLDLRIGSPTYGRHASLELDAERGNMIYVPRGVAHGFAVLGDSALMQYDVTTEYAPDHDAGILWSSAGIDWPVSEPLVSDRDAEFPTLAEFESPFHFGDRSGQQAA